MPQQQSIARFFGGSNVTKRKLDEKKDVKRIKKEDINTLIDEKNGTPEDKSSPVESGEPPQSPEKAASAPTTKTEASKLITMTDNEAKKHTNETLGPKIPYAKLTEVFEKIEGESSRLAITAIVSQFFQEILEQSSPDKLVKIVYLFINRLGPDYEPDLELGLGETLLIKAISECYGRAPAKIKKDYHEVGDLGIVAQKSRSGQPTMFRPTSLDVDTVFENLTKIAKFSGKDSQGKKIGMINKMLTACDLKSNEAKFLIRSLEGKLRIGLAEKTVLIALAQAFVNHELSSSGKKINPEKLTSAEDIVREAFSRTPNYEVLIKKAAEFGVFNLLEHCKLTPGIPLKPMLAKPTKSISEVLDRFQGEDFTCEYKYDGERAQVHLLETGEVRIYSRNSEDMSQRYPDLISILKDFVKTQAEETKITSMVLDCEAVAWDRVNNKILPFQVLSTRKRKDVDEKDIKVHICLFAFDLLYYNGEPLITKSLADRREIMHKHIDTIEGKFQFATAKNSSNLDELQAFLDQSVKDACEGLMVKMLHGPDSYYEPSKRSRNWLKLKKDYLAGVGDSLDLVVIGAYIGRGKRTGGYGGFLLASYNQDTGEYETTCKIGTGFSEQDLADLHAKLSPTEIKQPKSYYVYDTTNSNAVPDVWFEPTLVFEVLTADLSLSPIYKAAHHEYGKGISLRFPRFLRVRDDKGIEDATSSTEVAEFYERQANMN
ncbi:DNA ligase 1 [Naganishia cerealis]|nr:DNA ligase 1 [Naganishia cerealis]